MMISKKHRFVFVSIPKNATNTMYRMLENTFGAKLYNNEFHSWEVPKDVNKYFKFAVIRNPYDRAVSAWKAIMQNKQINHDDPVFDSCPSWGNFEVLLSWAIANPLIPGSLRPQMHFLDMVKVNKTVKIERLDSEVMQLPFAKGMGISLPRINSSNRHPNWETYMSKTAVKAINTLYKRDFECLDYERIKT